jgi:hypothetical protein
MAETSLFWGGTTIGDHGTYTDDQFSDFIGRLFHKDRTLEGVLPFYSSALATTNPAGVTIRVAPGAAVVDGKLYESSGNVDHTVAAPGAGFNYYSIVLTKDFAAQTVRQTLLGPSTVAYPTVTQTDGTKWEILVAKISVSSAGAIVVTDARTYCHFNSMVSEAMLEAGSVTNTKLGALAVTGSKIASATITDDKLATPNPANGWIPGTGWSYASSTTINVPSGAALIYTGGDRFTLVANSVTLQGYIVKVADTLLTVRGDAITNFVFSSVYYSHQSTPIGFRQLFQYVPTGPTNCTLEGQFSLQGADCHATIVITGTGNIGFGSMPSLPVPVTSVGFSLPIYGVASYYDDTGIHRYNKIVTALFPSQTAVWLLNGELYDPSGNMLDVTNVSPITWVANDKIYIDVKYPWMSP